MKKEKMRARRKKSIRKKISGTAERPRMCVHKSLRNISVQIVDDIEGKTILGLTTLSGKVKDKIKKSTKKDISTAQVLGEEVAKEAVAKGISKVIFDRSGYRYHGVIKTVADAARKNGLEF